MSTSIKAVLVKLSISMFNNTRQDPGITGSVKALHKLTGKAGRWIKYKLPDECLEPIRKVASEARAAHYRLTLPWEEGYGLLPIKARTAYEQDIKVTAKAAFDAAVDAFVASYEEWKKQAKLMHNGTFQESDYPPASELRKHFGFTVEPTPVPEVNHFDTELRGLYGEALQESVAAKIEAAVRETWDRILQPVAHMVDRLSGDEAVFRDSLVDNIRDIVQIAPAMNLTNDPQIAAAVEQVKTKLATLNPDVLRDNKLVRRTAADHAKNILSKFGKFGSRKLAA